MIESYFSLLIENVEKQLSDNLNFVVPCTLKRKKNLWFFSVYMVFDVTTIADKHYILELI